MSEIICINGNFNKDAIVFWSSHGVTWPQEGKIYSIRDVIINSIGKTGLLLNEIVNPKVLILHPLTGTAMMEPNWDKDRFTDLQGNEITQEMIREAIKQNQHEKS